MTDASNSASRRWRVTMADDTARSVAAHSFRVEAGALVFILPAGCAAAYAPGTWATVEHDQTGDAITDDGSSL